MKTSAQKIDYSEIKKQLQKLKSNPAQITKKDLELIIRCIDLTSLNGNDTAASIKLMCNKAKDQKYYPASVCIYPVFIKQARKELKGTGIKVAAVAGGFPSGQSPLKIKLKEVKYALSQGADEIDFTISRKLLLEEKYEKVSDEISAIKKLCKGRILKVILETGELGTTENIFYASTLAMEAGADFIKTSTGKIPAGATLESACSMLLAIKEFHNKTGKVIGIKPSGGIATINDAFNYIQLTQNILGEEWLAPERFRLGASRLFDEALIELKSNRGLPGRNHSKTA